MAKCMQCGSSTKMKKMAKGGPINKPMTYAKPPKGGSNLKDQIYGVPNAGMTGPNRNSPIETMKKGGNVKSVKHSCPPGTVRMPDGRCGTRETPSFKKGGSTFGMLSVKAGVDNNPGKTAADRIAGAKMNKKKMGGMIKAKKK